MTLGHHFLTSRFDTTSWQPYLFVISIFCYQIWQLGLKLYPLHIQKVFQIKILRFDKNVEISILTSFMSTLHVYVVVAVVVVLVGVVVIIIAIVYDAVLNILSVNCMAIGTSLITLTDN